MRYHNTRKRLCSSKAGFTLIEITVTIFLIGILLSLVLPRLPDITGYRLKSYTRKLANIIKYIRSRSVVEKNVFRMNFDIKKGDYWIDVLRGKEFMEYNSHFNTRGSLPYPIRFEDIETEINGKMTTGTTAIHFSTHGFVEKTIIHIADSNRQYTLFIQPATGRVKIKEGYVERRLRNE